jgi:hypothetical protein
MASRLPGEFNVVVRQGFGNGAADSHCDERRVVWSVVFAGEKHKGPCLEVSSRRVRDDRPDD